MQVNRRGLIAAAMVAGFGGLMGASGEEPAQRLYRTISSASILSAARALIAEDAVGTLITVDRSGQPRARSIRVSAPDSDLTLWMGTRKGSRKLEQIAANRRATLHFAEDQEAAYLSLMGEVQVVADPATIALKNPFKGRELEEYFPVFPNDFVLLSFQPRSLEIVTKAIPTKADTWQPQGVAV